MLFEPDNTDSVTDAKVIRALKDHGGLMWRTADGLALSCRVPLPEVLDSLARLLASGRVGFHPTKHHLFGVTRP